MDKLQAAQDGVSRCLEFFELNGMAPPSFELVDAPIGSCGYYETRSKRVVISLTTCRSPTKSPYAWSFPGYKADLTPFGVIAHECGHHVHFSGSIRVLRFKEAFDDEPPVSSYGATKLSEDWAETFRLFVTNPDFLRLAWPRRYAFCASSMTPIETRRYFQVLGSSYRHVMAAHGHIKRAEKRHEHRKVRSQDDV